MSIDTRLHADSYSKSRLQPHHRQKDYLCLADLALWLRSVAPSFDATRILDYGSGSAPYKSLFVGADYTCADFGLPSSERTLALSDDGMLSELADGSFDGVVSFQVLEHVPDTDAYLAEAYRVLSPGGRILLTTHGTFPKHSVPQDLWRWTEDGLVRAVSALGFEVERSVRLTNDFRALTQLALLRAPDTRFFVPIVSGINLLVSRVTRNAAVCSVPEPDGGLAVIVAVIASKKMQT